MAAQSQKDYIEAGEREEYPKARKKNGVFILPWAGEQPSFQMAMKWFLTSQNNSNVPGSTFTNFYRLDKEARSRSMSKDGMSKDVAYVGMSTLRPSGSYNKELDKTLPVLSPDKAVLDAPPPNDIQVTWIGHATVLVQMDGLNILTDPVFNHYCGIASMIGVKRYRPVPCTVNELPDIDAVCISHNHYDHLDYNTVCDLNKRFGKKIHWFVPMGLRKWMTDTGCENVVELEWWDEHSHPKFTDKSKAVKFAFTPAQHWCRRGLNDTNKVLWGSWSIIGPQHRFYFAGDTGYCHIFKQIGKRYGPFDLAAIPIGAYQPRGLMEFQHVDPQEAVEIHEDIRSNFSLGIHWGTFNLSYEHYLQPPKELREILESKGIPQKEFHTIKHGEVKVITKEDTKLAEARRNAVMFESTT